MPGFGLALRVQGDLGAFTLWLPGTPQETRSYRARCREHQSTPDVGSSSGGGANETCLIGSGRQEDSEENTAGYNIHICFTTDRKFPAAVIRGLLERKQGMVGVEGSDPGVSGL